jgi:hypothetical protein
MQVEHAVAPTTVEYVLAARSMHVVVKVAPGVVEYLPAGQSVLTEAPVTDLYFPAAHLTQEMWSGPALPHR